MNRRKFLFLEHEDDKCARLSCRHLFMYYRDLAHNTPAAAEASPENSEWWAGEPDSELALESPESFFQHLAEALRNKRRLELTDWEWLGESELRQAVERLLEGFRAGGGEVSIVEQAPATEAGSKVHANSQAAEANS